MFRDYVASIPDLGWPLGEIRERVAAIHAAGIAEEEERAELAEIMRQLAGVANEDESLSDGSTSLPLDDPPPAISFPGKEFCVTGKFAFGTRSNVFKAIEARSGIPNPTPRETTDFLVVGTFCSRDWTHATYGRKIEHAVQLRQKRTGIKIVSEQHWIAALKFA